jgi:hypothetical protein
MVAIGPTQEVISTYLNRNRNGNVAAADAQGVSITKVTVRNQDGECLRFQSGEKAWIDIELTAVRHCSKLSVSLYFTDEQYQSIFDTSTQRLGHGHFTLEPGEVYTCTFELQLNLATGLFHPSILVYRYDTQTEYDRWAPATTIYLESGRGAGGVVNCAPQVVRQEIRAASNGIAVVASKGIGTSLI